MRLQPSCIALVCSAWLTLFTQLPALAGTESPGTCDLFTKADAQSLFQETVSDGRSRSSMAPAGHSCRYSFDRDGTSYSVSVRVSETAAIVEEGIFDSAEDVFSRQKRALESSAHAGESYRTVTGLGDDAFWNGSDLWMISGQRLVVITVNPVVEGTYGSMEELNAARAEKSLALSKTAASTILQRLQ